MQVGARSEQTWGNRAVDGIGTFVVGGAVQGSAAMAISMLPSDRAFEFGMGLAAAGMVTSAALGVDAAVRGLPMGVGGAQADRRTDQLVRTGVISGAVAGAILGATDLGASCVGGGPIVRGASGAGIGALWGLAQGFGPAASILY